MGRTVTLQLNDALYNAGILGFIKVCEMHHRNVDVHKDTLQFDSDILEEFTVQYLDTLIDHFRNDTIYTEILNRHHSILGNELEEKTIHEHIKFILEKLSRASYIAGYEIIKKYGETFDFQSQIKRIKTEEVLELKRNLLTELLDKLKDYEDILLLKDIAYTKIQTYWTNMAFLNKQLNTVEFHTTYENSFTRKAYAFEPPEPDKAKLFCCQCNTPLSGSDYNTMSWINDVGIDMKRKTSHYWNFIPDTFLCPVCNLIYSCIPLGFTMSGSDGIFINNNKNIKILKEINDSEKKIDGSSKTDVYWRVMQLFMTKNESRAAKNELENIQVVRRRKNQYFYNILSKEKLQIIKDCEKSFQRISTIYITINGVSISLYLETMNCILLGKSLYSLIHDLLHKSVESGQRYTYIYNVILIQSHTFLKGDAAMNDKKNFHVANYGLTLRKIMMGDDRNANKVRTLSYHLLNCLKSRDKNEFSNILLRQYISLGLPAPDCMTDFLKEEDTFLILGHCFVAGLNEGIYVKEKEEIKE